MTCVFFSKKETSCCWLLIVLQEAILSLRITKILAATLLMRIIRRITASMYQDVPGALIQTLGPLTLRNGGNALMYNVYCISNIIWLCVYIYIYSISIYIYIHILCNLIASFFGGVFFQLLPSKSPKHSNFKVQANWLFCKSLLRSPANWPTTRTMGTKTGPPPWNRPGLHSLLPGHIDNNLSFCLWD